MTIGFITGTTQATAVQTVTATGAVVPTAGLDISKVTGDFTLFIEIQTLTGTAAGARIQLEEGITTFSAPVALPLSVDVLAPIGLPAEKYYSLRRYQCPNTLAGTSGAVLRCNVVDLPGTSSSLTVRSWCEY